MEKPAPPSAQGKCGEKLTVPFGLPNPSVLDWAAGYENEFRAHQRPLRGLGSPGTLERREAIAEGESKDEAMLITGGCRCGAVRYKVNAERITARHCWCRDCQYIGAGSGTVNVFFPSESVKVEGVLSDYTSAAASGNLMHRQFCPTCGTPVSHL